MEWYDIRKRSTKLRPVSIVIGGRGIGKTYSALSFLLETGKKFLYLRNTDKQMSLCASAFGNPFKKVASDLGRDVTMKAAGEIYVVKEANNLIGYGAALSTFENLRGVDLSDVEYVLFDEFIENRKLSFKQGSAFMNLYETINRNRELEGRPPLICILLSNAQKLNNPILADLGLIPVIEDMIRNLVRLRITKEYYIELPESSVSAAKSETALYKLAAGSRYADEALRNEFANDSFFNVGKKPLQEFRPVCALDGIYIYRHKSGPSYYCCRSRAEVMEYDSGDQGAIFNRLYGIRLRAAYAAGNLSFSEFTIKCDIVDKLKL